MLDQPAVPANGCRAGKRDIAGEHECTVKSAECAADRKRSNGIRSGDFIAERIIVCGAGTGRNFAGADADDYEFRERAAAHFEHCTERSECGRFQLYTLSSLQQRDRRAGQLHGYGDIFAASAGAEDGKPHDYG